MKRNILKQLGDYLFVAATTVAAIYVILIALQVAAKAIGE